jgi:hypothetical protein
MRGWTWAGDAYVYHGQLAASFAFACVYTPAHLRARVGLIIPSRPSSPADWNFFFYFDFFNYYFRNEPGEEFSSSKSDTFKSRQFIWHDL